ncbi:Crp/Fnr family transcriptional regulator [Bowmanella yangjiangensis]|uniref:Crp/Fnr family transcriptional regulator n=1 Tax=Bowmanella yangjiangensis TaxID=2811230 RepID=A0ABS3CMS8_9ALTE|nr:Crp/Fnr family transcriptional regulator [Bowmanella yangjiangensis]MBN7818390.1 Crp/Fnr family transcriptional regulator [Bowmanella yangjiangensis]
MAFVELCNVEKLHVGQCLHEVGKDIRKVYFPLTGYAGLHAAHEDKQHTDVTLLGCEGVIGASVLLGVRRAPFGVIVQGAGLALSLSPLTFIRQVKLSKELRRVIKLYLFLQLGQLTLSAACLSHHDVRSRLARWLLMGHDRADKSILILTHLALAQMLGVRRSAVTLAARQLQENGVIRYQRGRIEVISRSGLESYSCNCYRTEIDNYNVCLPLRHHHTG